MLTKSTPLLNPHWDDMSEEERVNLLKAVFNRSNELAPMMMR